MLTNDMLVKVTNRSNSLVGYKLPEFHIKRRFSKNETKQLTVQEIRALNSEKGGHALIKNHLIIDNEELVNELIFNIQPEYYYTEKDVIELLLNGSADQLLDALDFGPHGVHDIIKSKAVELNLNDLRKREIILEKTGFDVTAAINANEQSNVVPVEAKTRRAAPITATQEKAEEPVRRTTVSRFKITTTSNEE